MCWPDRNRIIPPLTLLALALLLILPSSPAAAGHAAAAPLVFAGSGTNLPIVKVLVKAFQRSQPNISVSIPASIGSSGAIQAAADGAITLGLISRGLRPKEKEKGLTVVHYARTPLIIGVHPSVSEESLSYADLLAIYRGEKRLWRSGQQITVLTREPGDSSVEVLTQGIPGFKAVYEESQKKGRWNTLLTDQVMNETLAKIPDAIGLTDLGALTLERYRIKPLQINGVAPTPENLQSGKYPFFKTLSFVYRQDKISAETRLFIDFVRSKEGARILRTSGYLVEI